MPSLLASSVPSTPSAQSARSVRTPSPSARSVITPAVTRGEGVRVRRVPRVIGVDVPVPVRDGGHVPYANLDYAASAPCLEAVHEAVTRALPYYSSVHRGAGYASQVTTGAFEEARETVRSFVGAWRRSAVVFTRNTTDAMNLLAHAVPAGTSVVVFETEHHASLLPWRRAVRLPAPATPAEAVS
ncbi:MAG: aminotransferase class V-fold PLP-dependent enzyme, partial [Spirillospora sp.]